MMTYKAIGRSIINYAAPVWSTNLRDTNDINIQYTQNESLRISTGCHKISSVNHLHTEANVLLKVREHSELLSAQYLARCLEQDNVVVVSTHSLDPRLWGESDHPAFGPPASISLHLVSNSITPAGSVPKSSGDSVVCRLVQLKRWCVSCV